jgi:hypothetical protein
MKLIKLQDNIKPWPVFYFLVLITISGLVTTIVSYQIVYALRIILAAINVAYVVWLAVFWGVTKNCLISLSVCVTMFLSSNFIANLNSVPMDRWVQNFADFGITAIGIFLFSAQHSRQNKIISDKMVSIYIYYTVVGICGLIFTDGLALDPFPRFVFSYEQSMTGKDGGYSLMLTSFFSISAIFSMIGILQARTTAFVFMYYILALFLCSLSGFAGGRGEIISLVIVTIIVFAKFAHSKNRRLVFLLTVLAIIQIFIVSSVFEYMVANARFQLLLDGDFSDRNVLLQQVVELIKNEPGTFIFGGGTGYFQSYYGYDFGLYPHNHLAEAVVIFGFPLVFFSVLFVVRGGYIYYRQAGEIDLFMIIVTFIFISNLKSGYFLGNWMTNAAGCFFIGLNVQISDRLARPETRVQVTDKKTVLENNDLFLGFRLPQK